MNENNVNSGNLKRFYQAMAILRQKIETLLDSTPELLKINNLAELPPEKAKVVEEQLWDIFVYGEYYVARIISACYREPIVFVSEAGKANFEYHDGKYKSFVGKIRGLIDVSNVLTRREVEEQFVRLIDESSATDADYRFDGSFADPSLAGCIVNSIDDEKYRLKYERHVERGNLCKHIRCMCEAIKSVREDIENKSFFEEIEAMKAIGDDNSTKKHHIENFRFIGECAYLYLEHIDWDCKETWAEIVHPIDYQEIINKPYFSPDDWVANEKELHSIVIDRKREQMPQNIQKRILEIHNSFIFGNWMSVIALSRCLLEYAIIDRKFLLKIDLFKPDKKWRKPLAELVDDAKTVYPKMAKGERIIEAGNKVMHPSPRGTLSQFPPGKADAKDCMNAITEVISVLYSKPNNSGNPFN